MAALTALGEEQADAENQLQQRMDTWWNEESQETQMAAFYCVVSRIVQAELREDTTYRSLMRGTFEFGEQGYGLGLACGAMGLHNAIVPPQELSELRALQREKQRQER